MTQPSSESLQIAARCWCDPENSSTVMDSDLAVSFARRLDKAKEITTEQAVKQLCKALKEDPGFWISWKANIAMAFIDNAAWFIKAKNYKEGESLLDFDFHEVSNRAAEYFLTNLTKD